MPTSPRRVALTARLQIYKCRACGETMQISDKEAHAGECAMAQVCPHRVSPGRAPLHPLHPPALADVCPRLQVACECGERVGRGELSRHKRDTCVRRSVECEFCEQSIGFVELLGHQEYCGTPDAALASAGRGAGSTRDR